MAITCILVTTNALNKQEIPHAYDNASKLAEQTPMSLIARSLIALQDNSLTMPLLTEISTQNIIKKYENYHYQRTHEASKNDDSGEWPKFLKTIYNKENSWGITTAKEQRTKKLKANSDIDVDETVEAVDQLKCIVKECDNHNVTTTKMIPFGPILGNADGNNKQDIPESKDEEESNSMRHEISSNDVVDANERYQNTNRPNAFSNRKTIQVVNIERLQRQTIQIQNAVSILPANPSNTAISLNLEEIIVQDVEMRDLDNTNVVNTTNLKIPDNFNTLQSNSAVDLERYCLGCKRKLTLESNSVETPKAKRPRLEQPVLTNACSNNETLNRNKKIETVSPISTIVTRNISPNFDNILVPVNNTSSDNRNKSSNTNSGHKLELNVEITTINRRKLSFQQTLFIKEELTTMILQITNNNSEHNPDIFVPRFVGKPVHSNGVLKLWCEDTSTLIWLKNSINLLPVPGLAVKRQCDKFIRIQFIKAGIFIPWIYYEKNEIIQVLKFMNPWAAVETWPIDGTEKHGDYLLFTVGIPFEIIDRILHRGRVMQFVMGTVRVRFFKGKELIETPHDLTNAPRARAWHTRWRQRHVPVQNWASRLPRH